jgi:hypothetical protein
MVDLRTCCAKGLLSTVLLSVATAAQNLPQIKAETLSGKQVVLPDAAYGKVALLIVGFTRKSGTATRAWGERLAKDYASDARLVTYQLAVLEDVPRFIRGFVTRGIRNSVPKERHDNFVLLFQDEKAWKAFVGFAGPDEAYLLLLDPSGNLARRTHGVFSEVEYHALREHVDRLFITK